jgi:TolB-like protein
MTSLRFGRLEWSPTERRLLVDGEPAEVGARAFDLLSTLIKHRDRVVGKDELLRRVWQGVVVEENNLTVQVAALRKVVGAKAIATVPGRGYRWAAPLSEPDAAGPPGAAPGPRPTISVLPFGNPGGNPQEEYLADGLAEDIAAGLARSPWLFVIAQDSARTFRDSALPPAELCRRLGAQYLVRGSVRRAGGRLRVSAELLHGENAEVLLAERYDRPTDDLFALQDELTERIVATVVPLFLKHEATKATAREVRELRHWELLMRARWHYWRSSRGHHAEAKRLLAEALARRPDDVVALSMLAFCLATEVWSGWAADAKATMLEALRLAQRAVAVDERDSFAHVALGVTLAGFGQLDRAIAEQRRALELYPHFAAAAGELGRLLAFAGETTEAREWTRRAMAASPTEPRVSLWLFGLGIADFVDGDWPQAARHAAQAVSHRPDWFFNHYLLAASLVGSGDLESARAAFAEGQRLLPGFDVAAMRVGHPFRHDAPRDRYIQALKGLGWKG